MIQVSLEQGTSAWKRWRAQGIGGSDAGAIWAWHRKDRSLWPYTPAGLVMREKCRHVERESTFAMRRGNRLEPLAREMYCLERSVQALPLCVEHEDPDLRWLKASLDGYVVPIAQTPDANCPRWLIEIKAPAWQWHDWALAGEVPSIYRAQCQHNLFVSGLDRCDYISFNNGRRFSERDHMAVVRVEPDGEMLSELLDAEERFWKRVKDWRAAHDALLAA